MSQLTIYFTLHQFPVELQASQFQTNFDACQTFIVENADRWDLAQEALENQYNLLSRGKIPRIERFRPGDIEAQFEEWGLGAADDFTTELDATIHCSQRKIVLEHSPVPRVDIERFPSILKGILDSEGVEKTVATCRRQQEELAAAIIQRDTALVDLIDQESKSASKVFAFRGAAHEASMLHLLKSRNIPATPLRFHPEPFLEELIVSPLTLREAVQEEVIRRYLCRIMRYPTGYEELLDFDKEAKNMSKEDLESCLAKGAGSTRGVDEPGQE